MAIPFSACMDIESAEVARALHGSEDRPSSL